MDGLPTNIHRGHAGWCHNRYVFFGVFAKIRKQGGFARTSSTGNKNMIARIFKTAEGFYKIIVKLKMFNVEKKVSLL